jgi:hypothetical protein
MKDMRERLLILGRQLTARDKRICGDAATWIIDTLALKLGVLLQEQAKEGELGSRVDAFLLGATRYLADQCGSECDTLLTALHSLTMNSETTGWQ